MKTKQPTTEVREGFEATADAVLAGLSAHRETLDRDRKRELRRSVETWLGYVATYDSASEEDYMIPRWREAIMAYARRDWLNPWTGKSVVAWHMDALAELERVVNTV